MSRPFSNSSKLRCPNPACIGLHRPVEWACLRVLALQVLGRCPVQGHPARALHAEGGEMSSREAEVLVRVERSGVVSGPAHQCMKKVGIIEQCRCLVVFGRSRTVLCRVSKGLIVRSSTVLHNGSCIWERRRSCAIRLLGAAERGRCCSRPAFGWLCCRRLARAPGCCAPTGLSRLNSWTFVLASTDETCHGRSR